MRTRSWWWHGPRLLFASLPLLPLACSSNDPTLAGDSSVGQSGSSSGTTGTPSGGSAGLPAAGGSGGTVMGTGGSTGGSAAGTVGGSAGLPGAGGSVAGGSGGALSGGGTGALGAGFGGTIEAGGVAGLAGTGGDGMAGSAQSGTGGTVTDPCATVTCGEGQTCQNGTCMCMMGTLCSGSCVDTMSDAANCGSCGMACASGGACVDGSCVNPMCNPDTQQRSGHITHYTLATSMVACHYPTNTLPQYYGAMNEYDWNTAAVCGSCVEITNTQNNSKLTVQITDECPYKGNEQWCFQGSHHIDLNDAAYGALGANNNPAINWKYVPCNTMGNMKFYFDSASQQYYLAVTPMNTKNPVAKMEVKKGGAYTTLSHTNYNTYEVKDGAGTGELTFRLTDIYNHVVTDTVMMTPGQVVPGNVQFAACP